MRFDIYYDPELDVLGRQVQMSIYTPFRELIEWICMEVGLRQADWTFAFGPPDDDFMGLVHIDEALDLTPDMLGYTDDWNEQVYCYPKAVYN